MDKFVEGAVIAVCIMIASILYTGECFAAEPYKVKLNLLPFSYHHDRDDYHNESHHGVGLSINLPNDVTYGLMHFRNSHGENGWLLSAATESDKCFWSLCPGMGVGYAPAYKKDDQSVIIGWLSLRYKWVTLMTAPTEVTTLMFSVPLRN